MSPIAHRLSGWTTANPWSHGSASVEARRRASQAGETSSETMNPRSPSAAGSPKHSANRSSPSINASKCADEYGPVEGGPFQLSCDTRARSSDQKQKRVSFPHPGRPRLLVRIPASARDCFPEVVESPPSRLVRTGTAGSHDETEAGTMAMNFAGKTYSGCGEELDANPKKYVDLFEKSKN
jgi:hypothetical protein